MRPRPPGDRLQGVAAAGLVQVAAHDEPRVPSDAEDDALVLEALHVLVEHRGAPPLVRRVGVDRLARHAAVVDVEPGHRLGAADAIQREDLREPHATLQVAQQLLQRDVVLVERADG
eukprot:9481876-Pyramimonas_sp.AAC.2